MGFKKLKGELLNMIKVICILMKMNEDSQEFLLTKVVVCQVSERDMTPVSDVVLHCIRATGVLPQPFLPGVF